MNINLNDEIEELRNIKISTNDLKRTYNEIDSKSKIKKSVKEIINILDNIYLEIFNNSNYLKKFSMYGEFYIPTITKIINKYNNLSKKNTTSNDVKKLLENIEITLEKLINHFQNKYNSFFEEEVIDLNAEIKVLIQELNGK